MSENKTLVIECKCGSVAGTVNAQGVYGYRAVCMCDDCQVYAHWLGNNGILDANGGTDIFPLTPARVRITKGEENMKCVRLGPKGMFRWYAGCCKTPIANVMNSKSIAYVGMVHSILDKRNDDIKKEIAFGPIRLRMQGKFGIGKLPPDTVDTVTIGFLLRVVKFIILSKWRKESSPSPFVNEKGEPVVMPYILSVQELASLRPKAGPRPVEN